MRSVQVATAVHAVRLLESGRVARSVNAIFTCYTKRLTAAFIPPENLMRLSQGRRPHSSTSNETCYSRTFEIRNAELLTNSDAGVSPHTPVSVPYRFSACPIAIGCRGYIYRRWWCVVAWTGGRGTDNSPCGEATYEPCRHIAAACMHWRGHGGRELQRCAC